MMGAKAPPCYKNKGSYPMQSCEVSLTCSYPIANTPSVFDLLISVEKMQLILIVYRAHICKFAYMLKFIYGIKINITALLPSFAYVGQNTKKKKKRCHSMHTFPAHVKHGRVPFPCFSSHGLFNDTFSCYCIFFSVG